MKKQEAFHCNCRYFDPVKQTRSQYSDVFLTLVSIHYLYNFSINYLKHKRKEMKLEELIVLMRIEEDNRKSKRRVAGGQGMHAKANIVEQG